MDFEKSSRFLTKKYLRDLGDLDENLRRSSLMPLTKDYSAENKSEPIAPNVIKPSL